MKEIIEIDNIYERNHIGRQAVFKVVSTTLSCIEETQKRYTISMKGTIEMDQI
jgi:hypothetical protein